MKKLLTMIGAAAAAFGLYAADAGAVGGTNFETEEAIVPAATGLWGGAEGATKLDITAYEGSPITKPTNVPEQWRDDGAGLKFLDIKTDGFNKPLWGYIDEDRTPYAMKDATDNSLFFDGNVQFTAFDDEESVAVPDDNTKLMVWVKENTDQQGEANGTYELMVTAGKWDSEQTKWVAQNYDCGPITDLDTMKRVTIKSVGNIYATGTAAYGFEVYINGTVKPCTDDKGLDTTRLTAVAKASNQYGYLFPSIVQAETVTSVGFAGQGQVDCLSFTYTAPSFAQDSYFTINWDENVASVGYKLAGDANYTQCDMTGTSESIPYVAATTYALQVTYNENYAAGEWTGDDSVEFGENYATVTVSAPNQEMTIVSKDVTPRIVLLDEDGQPTTTTYATFGEALADVETAASFKLAQTVTMKATDDGDYWITEGQIEGKDITIDLNGQTINGQEDAECYVFNVVGGNLTVIDSSEGEAGRIVAASGNSGAIWIGCSGQTLDAKLTINKGTFDGAVVVDPGDGQDFWAADASIIAGSFDKASNGVTEFALADFVNEDTSDLSSDDNYWIVTEAQQFTVSFWDGDKQLVEIPAQTVKDGGYATEPESAPEKEYYTFAKWVDGDGEEFVFETTPITADTKIYASWTANEYDAKFFDGEKELTDLAQKFTADNASTMTLPAGPAKNGFKFIAWYPDEECEEDQLGNEIYVNSLGEGFEAYAKYEALPVVAKINDTPYYSLADAVAEADPTDTITVVADIDDVDLEITKTVKIDATGYTLTGKLGVYAIRVMDGDLTVLGGTFQTEATETRSLFLIGAYDDGAAQATVLPEEEQKSGALTIKDGTFGGVKVGNIIKVAKGTCVVDGGTLTDTNSRGIKADGPAVITINGGTIGKDGKKALAVDQGGKITVNGGDFYGTFNEEGGEGSDILIPGNSSATFDRDQSDFCAPGFETKLDGDKYKVFAKASPVDPEKPSAPVVVEGDQAAADAAAADWVAQNGVKAPADVELTLTTDELKAAYQANFTGKATPTGEANTYTFKAVLADQVVTDIKAAEATAAADVIANLDAENPTATVATKVGLYYGVGEAATVDGNKAVAEWVIGDGTVKELPFTKAGDARFYQIKCAVVLP